MHPIMTFSISIAMTMHFGSGISRYARKCQKSLTSFERRQVVLVIWLMPSEDYKLIKLLFSLKWNFVFPFLYFFGAFLPKRLERLVRNVFQAIGLRGTWVAPSSPSLAARKFRFESTLKPESSKEVRSTRSKS